MMLYVLTACLWTPAKSSLFKHVPKILYLPVYNANVGIV